jgi:hypothetical protein
LGVQFLAGASFLDTNCYKTNDCHWNEKGHREIAKMLSRVYSDHQSRSLVPRRKGAETFVPA